MSTNITAYSFPLLNGCGGRGGGVIIPEYLLVTKTIKLTKLMIGFLVLFGIFTITWGLLSDVDWTDFWKKEKDEEIIL